MSTDIEKAEAFKEVLERKGFPEQIFQQLMEAVREGKYREIHIPFNPELGGQPVRGSVYFRRDDLEQDFEFFSFRLHLGKESDAPTQKNIFLVDDKNDIGLKEAYNLMQGREVYKELPTRLGLTPFWVSLAPTQELPSYQPLRYSVVNQLLENTIDHSMLREFLGPREITELSDSLKRGNRQEITLAVEGASKNLWVEALPKLGRISLEDSKGIRYDLMTAEQFKQAVTKELKPGKGRSI